MHLALANEFGAKKVNSVISEEPRSNEVDKERGDSTTQSVFDALSVPKAPISVGEYIKYKGKIATVQFIGETDFKEGVWIGIELRKPTGKYDGSVDEKYYFTCKPKFGLFIKPTSSKIHRFEGYPNKNGPFNVITSISPVTNQTEAKTETSLKGTMLDTSVFFFLVNL